MRYRWDPVYPAGRRSSPPADRDLRASDAERNDVAEKLSRHYADGRLDQVEFKARLDRAMGATTRGDLGGLFDDLPDLPEDRPLAPPRRRHLAPLVLVVALVVLATGAAASTVHVGWLLAVAVVLLLWHRSTRRHRGDPARDELDR
ncbi:MAG: DUF1707 domain-containing protein [Acidimicrobiales bacterium]